MSKGDCCQTECLEFNSWISCGGRRTDSQGVALLLSHVVWHAGVHPCTQNIVEKVLEIAVHFCNHSAGTSSSLAIQSS